MTARQQAICTLDELAAYLKVGKRTLYRLAAHGEIPAFKVGGTWRFRQSEIDRWINDQTQAGRKKEVIQMSSQSQRNIPCRLGALSVAAGKRSERESSIFLLEV
ncbi:helix-turn-helix domain-containing protein [Aquincola tertiaricarbonis]|uniref:helix-turn-helix domain-containing protein n=1 Tax=Aquincola tertiaricarbonis TaxID=391953 RepID=UPI004046BB90